MGHASCAMHHGWLLLPGSPQQHRTPDTRQALCFHERLLLPRNPQQHHSQAGMGCPRIRCCTMASHRLQLIRWPMGSSRHPFRSRLHLMLLESCASKWILARAPHTTAPIGTLILHITSGAAPRPVDRGDFNAGAACSPGRCHQGRLCGCWRQARRTRTA